MARKLLRCRRRFYRIALKQDLICAEADRGEARAAYRGVTRLEKERKWVARVWVDSKQKTVGRYDSDTAAAQVWRLLCPQ